MHPCTAPRPLSVASDPLGTRTVHFATRSDVGTYGSWVVVDSVEAARLRGRSKAGDARVVDVARGLHELDVADAAGAAAAKERVLVACLVGDSDIVTLWEARLLGRTRHDAFGFLHVKVRYLFASEDEYVHVKRVWRAPAALSVDVLGVKAATPHDRNPRY